MYEVNIRTHFSAAHRLKGYAGSCSKIHGHNWDVEVFVRGKKLNKLGILVDYRHIKMLTAEVIKKLDHADLNALVEFGKLNPTSENLARFLFRELSKQINGKSCTVSRVCVHETPETGACYMERE